MTLTAADIGYVRAGFVPLEELCAAHGQEPAAVRALVRRELLARPTYVLPDGTEMVPPDYFALANEAGSPEALPEAFARRSEAACRAEGVAVEVDWDGYLSGVYGACLREVTPESIVRKGVLVDGISALLAAPAPEDPEWGAALRTEVDELDGLEREFSPDCDRSARFPLSPTRDRLIRAARERFADVFATARP